ncbi:unnamed protein product [Paramecium primaurelia]|uniref:Uncharacterized protein n=1 Tax=Paramecium primaurelia TaxID=5886 RepID=A0A8S1KSY8_PARPR|nr:unnamed protein product [Paramecium primaurelia]
MKKPIQQKSIFLLYIARRLTRGFETVEQILSQPFDKSDWEKDKFENFHMGTRDLVEKGSQVLSNRQMLLKYGMILEYNKQDKLFKLNIESILLFGQSRDLNQFNYQDLNLNLLFPLVTQ